MMNKAPKSLRFHIGLFGRTNVGKSSFLNMVAGQDVAITSPIPGTTTDVVEKTMELLPLGPVVFLDTAGLDDKSVLSDLRIKKTKKVFERADAVVLLTEADIWSEYEDIILEEALAKNIPVIIAINKTDQKVASVDYLNIVKSKTSRFFPCSSLDLKNRDNYVNILKSFLIEVCPDDFLNPALLIGDLIPRNGLAVLIIPIDKEAPKGRIILPQVQAIRDVLDSGSSALVVKESEYKDTLNKLKAVPDIVVCDSQVVGRMVEDSPKELKCTTFSILLARFKGDLNELVKGVMVIDQLKPGDKVLIAESCSHHAIEDDIGRIKIPKWLEKYLGFKVTIDICSGKDYPQNLKDYKLVIHCGGCMMNKREMFFRIQKAKEQGVAITNYGVAISFLQGVLERVLCPFPVALEIFRKESSKIS